MFYYKGVLNFSSEFAASLRPCTIAAHSHGSICGNSYRNGHTPAR